MTCSRTRDCTRPARDGYRKSSVAATTAAAPVRAAYPTSLYYRRRDRRYYGDNNNNNNNNTNAHAAAFAWFCRACRRRPGSAATNRPTARAVCRSPRGRRSRKLPRRRAHQCKSFSVRRTTRRNRRFGAVTVFSSTSGTGRVRASGRCRSTT